MSKKSQFLKSATIALAGLTVMSSATSFAKDAAKLQKCYGVVKAGKNDCASTKKGGHSCAGLANASGDKNEWILLPEGTCERLVNGSTQPSNS